MSNVQKMIQALAEYDYEVMEFDHEHVMIKSVHDYAAVLITLHAGPARIDKNWVEQHLVDRMTPYMDSHYPGWKERRDKESES